MSLGTGESGERTGPPLSRFRRRPYSPRMRRVAVAAAALTLGAAVTAGGACSARLVQNALGRAGEGPLPCRPSQIALSQVGAPSAAGVNVAGLFSFTNTSPRACTLAGYPTFSAPSSTGKTALQRVRHGRIAGRAGTSPLRQPVELSPGSSAFFAVDWFSHQPAQYCLDPPTLYVSSAPPGSTRTLVTRLHIGETFCGPIVVGPVALLPYAVRG
jgi:Domain of unknown function (DUF4232)